MVESLNKRIEENADKMIQSLCEVVQIPSVYGEPQPGAPFGKESRRALQYAMDLGKKLGLKQLLTWMIRCAILNMVQELKLWVCLRIWM